MKKNGFSLFALSICSLLFASCGNETKISPAQGDTTKGSSAGTETSNTPQKNKLDTAEYDRLLQAMANNDTTGLWPVKAPYPLPGAIFPFKRVIAFYGNLYSTRMGILGELPKAQMFKKLQQEVANWQAADTTIPAIPALHYIAVTAQGSPGKDGKYRLRMPFSQIDTIMNWSKEIDALVFVDVQVGLSTLQSEIPELEKYLQLPQVHLGIDPEFSMKGGQAPGRVIGSFDSDDINYTINYLSDVVKKYNLPPKILVIHRFTQGMLKGYDKIKNTPEVQVLIDMDGWGDKILKKSSYLRYVYREPIHFTGFKIFYKNDTKTGVNQLYTPEELLKFIPKPIYIQYQ